MVEGAVGMDGQLLQEVLEQRASVSSSEFEFHWCSH